MTDNAAAPRFDVTAERAKLLQRDADWSAAAVSRDVDSVVSFWSDDAVVIPPGQPPVEGKAAIRAFVAGSLQMPEFSIQWKSDRVDFSPDGKLAYMRSKNVITVPGPDGNVLTLHARAITIWRMDPDGLWRCVVDIWNDAPPAAPAAG